MNVYIQGIVDKLRRFFEIIQHIFTRVMQVHRYNLKLICISTPTFITQYGHPLVPPHENEIVLQLPQPPPFDFACHTHYARLQTLDAWVW